MFKCKKLGFFFKICQLILILAVKKSKKLLKERLLPANMGKEVDSSAAVKQTD